MRRFSADVKVLAAKAGSEKLGVIEVARRRVVQDLSQIREVYKGQLVNKYRPTASASIHHLRHSQMIIAIRWEITLSRSNQHFKVTYTTFNGRKHVCHDQRDRRDRRVVKDDTKSFSRKLSERYRKRWFACKILHPLSRVRTSSCLSTIWRVNKFPTMPCLFTDIRYSFLLVPIKSGDYRSVIGLHIASHPALLLGSYKDGIDSFSDGNIFWFRLRKVIANT